jgi:hypothetical protein
MNLSVEMRPKPVSRLFINLECQDENCILVVLKIMSSVPPYHELS